MRRLTGVRTAAEAYDQYIGRYSPELARALIGAAGARPGHSAVDVGCGPGALTRELAELLGAGQVAAADPSSSFAQACAERLPGVRVEVAGAEQLPFPDDAFDFAFAQLVVNFMADPAAGVGEMRRVTRPGGTVAAAVWDYAGEMVLLRRFWDAATALDPAAAAKDEGRSMPFASPDELSGLLSAAGLAEVEMHARDGERRLRRLRGPVGAAGERRGPRWRLRRSLRVGGPRGVQGRGCAGG